MSNNIYTEKYNYVYMITEISTGMKYIGVRTSKILPQYDIGIKYFSSSKDKNFIQKQKNNPTDFKYDVIRIYDDRKDAIKHEIELHEQYDVGNNPLFYNRSKQTSDGWDASGMVTVLDSYGNTQSVSNRDPRYLSGELKHITTGMVSVIDGSGKTFMVSITDDRYINGELKSANVGLVHVIDGDGQIITTTINDPRYISGEYKHINCGRILSDEHKQKISNSSKGHKKSDETRKRMSIASKGKIVKDSTRKKISDARKNDPCFTCIHCGKTCNKLNHIRWHGDNCKKKGD